MQVSKEGNLITLINVFETTPEQQQALIDQWTRFSDLEDERVRRPLNATAPNPERTCDFIRLVGQVLGKPMLSIRVRQKHCMTS